MKVYGIDPRLYTTELHHVRYRVNFWDTNMASDEWELDEADVDEVLAWVEENAKGRTYSVWAVVPDGNRTSPMMVRLMGEDPA